MFECVSRRHAVAHVQVSLQGGEIVELGSELRLAFLGDAANREGLAFQVTEQ